MKLFLVIIFFIFFSINLWALAPHWKLISNINGVKNWQLKTNVNVMVSLERRSLNKKIDWSKVNQKSFFKKIENKKKKILKLIGISKWKANLYTWSTQEGSPKLEIQGSYLDSLGNEVSFLEIHVYRRKETIQMLHTYPKGDLKRDEYSRWVMSYLRRELLK